MLSNASLTCTYDSANRLMTAGGHTYTYNAENVRIRNLCSEEDTTYTYNTNAKLSQLLTKTTDGVVTKYVYGRGLIGEEVNNTFKTYHFDSRGSTIAITDASGNITDTFAYDTYGKLINRTGASKVIFGYNGRDGVVTDDNGLIYMRARYYSPVMKRFVNADIVAGSISNGVTLNRFAYANGNPVSFVDPFGLIADRASNQEGLKYTWEELGFVYDGSMRDFRRLEQGLPPYAYECWLKQNHTANYKQTHEQYSDLLFKALPNLKKNIHSHFASNKDFYGFEEKFNEAYWEILRSINYGTDPQNLPEGLKVRIEIDPNFNTSFYELVFGLMGFVPVLGEVTSIVNYFSSEKKDFGNMFDAIISTITEKDISKMTPYADQLDFIGDISDVFNIAQMLETMFTWNHPENIVTEISIYVQYENHAAYKYTALVDSEMLFTEMDSSFTGTVISASDPTYHITTP